MTTDTLDVPLILHPVVRMVEMEAIRMFRKQFADAPPWQELDASTRSMWVDEAERRLTALPDWRERCASAIRNKE